MREAGINLSLLRLSHSELDRTLFQVANHLCIFSTVPSCPIH